ncbi:MAG: 3-isopropylmalate dehydratase small subunit [Planctomycetota bacterium]
MEFIGKIWKFGDDIDTDVIIPARYLHSSEPRYLGQHCMEGMISDFSSLVKQGDIIVAGKNFGCGSSREQAVISLKACGISCVIAVSFARIFFRNAINTGFPVMESPDLVNFVRQGNSLCVNLNEGYITHRSSGRKFKIPVLPTFLQEIILAGGLINYVVRKNTCRVNSNDSEKVKRIKQLF